MARKQHLCAKKSQPPPLGACNHIPERTSGLVESRCMSAPLPSPPRSSPTSHSFNSRRTLTLSNVHRHQCGLKVTVGFWWKRVIFSPDSSHIPFMGVGESPKLLCNVYQVQYRSQHISCNLWVNFSLWKEEGDSAGGAGGPELC